MLKGFNKIYNLILEELDDSSIGKQLASNFDAILDKCPNLDNDTFKDFFKNGIKFFSENKLDTTAYEPIVSGNKTIKIVPIDRNVGSIKKVTGSSGNEKDSHDYDMVLNLIRYNANKEDETKNQLNFHEFKHCRFQIYPKKKLEENIEKTQDLFKRFKLSDTDEYKAIYGP